MRTATYKPARPTAEVQAKLCSKCGDAFSTWGLRFRLEQNVCINAQVWPLCKGMASVSKDQSIERTVDSQHASSTGTKEALTLDSEMEPRNAPEQIIRLKRISPIGTQKPARVDAQTQTVESPQGELITPSDIDFTSDEEMARLHTVIEQQGDEIKRANTKIYELREELERVRSEQSKSMAYSTAPTKVPKNGVPGGEYLVSE